MRFLSFKHHGKIGLAAASSGNDFYGYLESDPQYPGALETVIRNNTLSEAGRLLADGKPIDLNTIDYLPPLIPSRLFCMGLNYRCHVEEAGLTLPKYPTLFFRLASCTVGHEQPMIVPKVSEQLDFEGELVAILGKGGRHISKQDALDHVIGYSIFNEGSVRDVQLRTRQWGIGKTFDGTGPFGPFLVTSDELPTGASGLNLETRLNGEVMQSSNTDKHVFDVADVIVTLSEAITLEPGDIILMGTPGGVGHFRTPPRYLRPGDICDVEIEGIGTLSNGVALEQ